MNILIQKFKESILVILPITILVLILNFTFTPLESHLLFRFLFGVILIILGLPIFLFGVEIGITQIGNLMGTTLAKSNKFRVIVVIGLILGFIISIAEPALNILAGQVDFVTSGMITKLSIVLVTSIGIATMFTLGISRIVYNIPLYKILIILYAIIYILALFTTPEFLAISFDASAATTGAMAVPFILSLAAGISTLKKDSKVSGSDSFGLVGITSTGAIIAVMTMSIFGKTGNISADIEYSLSRSTSIITPFIENIPTVINDVFLALLPILLILLVSQKVAFKLNKKAFRTILKGLFYTFIGLILFLTGANAGFMDIGSIVGYNLASLNNNSILIIVGFILGLVTILAEPSVHVLTSQIEDVTSGYVKRKLVLFALSIGVGLAVALSMIRIISTDVQLWHYLLPGYLISIGMTYFVPRLFVGIAFDAGGVASGLMTTTFILAFAQGAAGAIEGANVLIDGFGIISMVALTPLLTLQFLGLIFKIKSRKGGLKVDGE